MWSLSWAFSARSRAISASRGSMFTVGFNEMFFARAAKRSVESVCCASAGAAPTQQSMVVYEFPPKESCSSRVSLESRYGTCVALTLVSAATTLPSAESEALMAQLSFTPWSTVWAWASRSDPAKSTRWNLARTRGAQPSCDLICRSNSSVKTAWDREDLSLRAVPRVVRRRVPSRSAFCASSAEWQSRRTAPSRKTPRPPRAASSRIVGAGTALRLRCDCGLGDASPFCGLLARSAFGRRSFSSSFARRSQMPSR
mmetsp:Transcript_7145/g.23257  ORF Transcript_7145/g.23257 Transcript_7145/m.23257 type:complete len:256 (-) Transcript_7145:384-1151(-)